MKNVNILNLDISSPQEIRKWAEFKHPNGFTLGRIFNDKVLEGVERVDRGLFCELTFGPYESYTCKCGITKSLEELKHLNSNERYCKDCGVEYIDNISRRRRLGYIEFFSSASHIWFLKNSCLSIYLGIEDSDIFNIVYSGDMIIEHGIPAIKKVQNNLFKDLILNFIHDENILKNIKNGIFKEEENNNIYSYNIENFLKESILNNNYNILFKERDEENILNENIDWLNNLSSFFKVVKDTNYFKHFRKIKLENKIYKRRKNKNKFYVIKNKKNKIKNRNNNLINFVTLNHLNFTNLFNKFYSYREDKYFFIEENNYSLRDILSKTSYFVYSQSLPFLPTTFIDFESRTYLLNYFDSAEFFRFKDYNKVLKLYNLNSQEMKKEIKSNNKKDEIEFKNIKMYLSKLKKNYKIIENGEGNLVNIYFNRNEKCFNVLFNAFTQNNSKSLGLKGIDTNIYSKPYNGWEINTNTNNYFYSEESIDCYLIEKNGMDGMDFTSEKIYDEFSLSDEEDEDIEMVESFYNNKNKKLINNNNILEEDLEMFYNEKEDFEILDEYSFESIEFVESIKMHKKCLEYSTCGGLKRLLESYNSKILCSYLKNYIFILSLINEELSYFNDLNIIMDEIEDETETNNITQIIFKYKKRYEFIKSLTVRNKRPEWLTITNLPVLPPDLRPIFISNIDFDERSLYPDSNNSGLKNSHINLQYQKILKYIKSFKEIPFVNIKETQRLHLELQKSVDALIDLSMSKKYRFENMEKLNKKNKELSETEMKKNSIENLLKDSEEDTKDASVKFLEGASINSILKDLKGKSGKFRSNLLGKRVDFSARSVIAVSPEYKLNECGLPAKIALVLFEYFLLKDLYNLNIIDSYSQGKYIIKEILNDLEFPFSLSTKKSIEIENYKTIIFPILSELIYNHPILLNRAPTLHRLGIQAFQSRLVFGNAILLHPLVCANYNADFDGDQMGVHLPITYEAISESWNLLFSQSNFLSPASGKPTFVPSQDMVIGLYYMTTLDPYHIINKFYNSAKQVVEDYNKNKIKINNIIWFKWNSKQIIDKEMKKKEKPIEIRFDLKNLKIYILYLDRILIKNIKTNKYIQYIRTCPGRIILNKSIYKDFMK